MTTETIRNDVGLVIGSVENDTYEIRYRSLSYGVIGYYDKQNNIYHRYRNIPGKPNQSMYGDMGMSDLRYWDGK